MTDRYPFSTKNPDLHPFHKDEPQYLMFSGLALATAGVSVLFIEATGMNVARVLVSLLVALSGLFSFIFSRANAKVNVLYYYYKIKGGVCILFSIFWLVVTLDIKGLLYSLSLFTLSVCLFEVVYEFILLNVNLNVKWVVTLGRFLVGFLGVMNALVIFSLSPADHLSELMLTGVVLILLGIVVVLSSLRVRLGELIP